MLITVAALYIDPRGPYPLMPNVECWGEARDARKYPGPHRVVAHPPCERWGRYWHGGPSARVRRERGADGGCFASALASVRAWGGVLEHPEASHAFPHHGLTKPPKRGGWVPAGDGLGYCCCVEQGHYGHRARKATWLYAVGIPLPELTWGPAASSIRLDAGFHSAEERRLASVERRSQADSGRLTARECRETPWAFACLLIGMCREMCPNP